MKGCGCPYMNMDLEKLEEICTLTNKPTNGAMKCDFGYDENCEEYKRKAVRARNEKQ